MIKDLFIVNQVVKVIFIKDFDLATNEGHKCMVTLRFCESDYSYDLIKHMIMYLHMASYISPCDRISVVSYTLFQVHIRLISSLNKDYLLLQTVFHMPEQSKGTSKGLRVINSIDT